MVSGEAQSKLDPVAARLAQGGELQSPSVLQWLDGQQQRKSMRRRAVMCVFTAWLLMTVAASVSCIVAWYMAGNMRQIQSEIGLSMSTTRALVVLPMLLVGIAVFLLAGGTIGWIAGRIPGLSKTVSAIDWSTASDAMTRLLTVGCTYPEAFRTAAAVSRSSPSRSWLMQAADRVERGGPQVVVSSHSGGDLAMLESLIDAAQHEPQRQWQVAADHFFELAQRRLVLLLQSIPMIATIISGLLIWIAISATLGWMWRAVAQLMGGLT